jgi:hypothetical protein
LHGRIGTLPAYDIRIERDWHDEQPVLRLHGTVDEVSLFSYKLRLERTLEFTPGEPEIRILDRVRNFGGEPAPLMVLYHCNFGFPVVSPDSVMVSPTHRVTPRDAIAEPGLSTWEQMHEPMAGYKEQVFFHDLQSLQGTVTAAIMNQRLGLGVEVRFDTSTVNYLTEWKQMGFGDYVLGIEPGNCLPEGRVKAREAGRLRMLPPGEQDTFSLAFRVVTG